MIGIYWAFSIAGSGIHYLQLKDSLRRENELLNTGFHIHPELEDEMASADIVDSFNGKFSILPILVVAEQSQHPDNRIVLTDQRDEIGMLRSKLVCRYNEIDYSSVIKSFRLLDQESIGRITDT